MMFHHDQYAPLALDAITVAWWPTAPHRSAAA
jgi:hypothetical protein